MTATNYFMNTFDLGPEDFPKAGPRVGRDGQWRGLGEIKEVKSL